LELECSESDDEGLAVEALPSRTDRTDYIAACWTASRRNSCSVAQRTARTRTICWQSTSQSKHIYITICGRTTFVQWLATLHDTSLTQVSTIMEVVI